MHVSWYRQDTNLVHHHISLCHPPSTLHPRDHYYTICGHRALIAAHRLISPPAVTNGIAFVKNIFKMEYGEAVQGIGVTGVGSWV